MVISISDKCIVLYVNLLCIHKYLKKNNINEI